VQAFGDIVIHSATLTTDPLSTILSTANGTTIDIESSSSVSLAGDTEVNGTGSFVTINSPSVEILQDGQVEALGLNGTITITGSNTVSIDAGGAVEAGSYYPPGVVPAAPVAGLGGGSVTLTSGHEMMIAGSVTTSNLLTITAGAPAVDNSAYFNEIGGYLAGESQYSVLVQGSLDAFGPTGAISITAPGAVILSGFINETGTGSSLQVQSNAWVYVSGHILAANSLGIYGGTNTDGTLPAGVDSNSRGMSVYVDTTGLIQTTAAGSQLTIDGAEHVRITPGAVALAGGTIGNSGVTFTGADATLTISAGDQVYVAGALDAGGTLQVENTGTPGANDRGLGVIVNTAGGLTAAVDVDISAVGSVEMMGHILSGGIRSTANAPVVWSGASASVLIQSQGQTEIGGQLAYAVEGLVFAQSSTGDTITRTDGTDWQFPGQPDHHHHRFGQQRRHLYDPERRWFDAGTDGHRSGACGN
jgi:hypothetical protein